MIFQIPGPSRSPMPADFCLHHIQTPGLINDGNYCCLICIILCFHRMRLSQNLNAANDFPTKIVQQVLQALPSAFSFSLEMLKQVWNQFRGSGDYRVSSYDDVWSTANGMMKRLRFQQCSPPVLTEFKLSYNCQHCGLIESVPPTLFSAVPILNVPNQPNPISIFDLFATFTQSPVPISCSCCRQNVSAYVELVPGRLTPLFFNRVEFINQVQQPLITTRLSLANNGRQHTLGEVICCVSNIQMPNGTAHWVTYSQIQGSWWLNSDQSIASRTSYHPFDSPNPDETCVFVVFEKT